VVMVGMSLAAGLTVATAMAALPPAFVPADAG